MSKEYKELITNMQRRIVKQRAEIKQLHKIKVKRGSWGNDGFCWVCSECNMYGVITYKYCPHCGAKMVEERNEQ